MSNHMPVLVEDRNTFEQWRLATNQIVKRLNLLYNADNTLRIQGSSIFRDDISVGRNLNVTGFANISKNLTVDGDLVIKGTTTTVNSEIITMGDKVITLNWSEDNPNYYDSNLISGLEVNLGTDDNSNLHSDGKTTIQEFLYNPSKNETIFYLQEKLKITSSGINAKRIKDYSGELTVVFDLGGIKHNFVIKEIQEGYVEDSGNSNPVVIVEGNAAFISESKNEAIDFKIYNSKRQFYWDEKNVKWVLKGAIQVQGDVEAKDGFFERINIGVDKKLDENDFLCIVVENSETSDPLVIKISENSNQKVGGFLWTGEDPLNKRLKLQLTDGTPDEISNILLDPNGNSHILKRLGIGTSNPNVQLDVIGNIRSSLEFISGNGTKTKPAYHFDSDSDTGMYLIETGKLSLATGGSDRITIDDGGYVGIGTTSPSAKLHVSTPAYDANNIVPILSAGYNTSATGHSSIAIGDETKASGQNSTAMGYGTIASGQNSTAMGSATEANGINSTSMGTKINVGGNYSFGISLNDPSTDYELTQANTMAIIGGKVGIGTTTPSAKLHVLDRVSETSKTSNKVVDSNCSFLFEDYESRMQLVGCNQGSYSSTIILSSVDSDLNSDKQRVQSNWSLIHRSANSGDGSLNKFQIAHQNISTTSQTDVITGQPSNKYLTIDTSGRVGIGTESPEGKLHIINQGDGQSDSDDGQKFYQFIDAYRDHDYGGGIHISHARGTALNPNFLLEDDILGGLSFNAYDPASGSYQNFDSSARIESVATLDHTETSRPANLVFRTTPEGGINTLPRMTINSDGKVGIGTTDPDAHLHTYSPSNTTINMIKASNHLGVSAALIAYQDSHAEVRVGTNHPLLFKTNDNNERMRISGSSSNVGIGGVDPLARLHIKNDQSSTTQATLKLEAPDPMVMFEDSTHDGDCFMRWQSGVGTAQGFRFWHNSNDVDSVGTTSGNPDFIIDLNGNVGIGVNSPSEKLHVGGLITLSEQSGLPFTGEKGNIIHYNGTLWAWDPNASENQGNWRSLFSGQLFDPSNAIDYNLMNWSRVNRAQTYGITDTSNWEVGDTYNFGDEDVEANLNATQEDLVAGGSTTLNDGTTVIYHDNIIGTPKNIPFTDAAGTDIFATRTWWDVGIGVEDPVTRLHIIQDVPVVGQPWSDDEEYKNFVSTRYTATIENKNTTGNGLQIRCNTTDSNVNIFRCVNESPTYDPLSGIDIGTERFVVKGDGKVGINTSDPLKKLHIRFDNLPEPASSAISASTSAVISGVEGGLELLSADNNTTVANFIGLGRYSQVDGSLIHKFGIVHECNTGSQGNNTGHSLSFTYGTGTNSYSNTEHLTILSGGNVGIGKPEPTAKLDIVSTITGGTTEDLRITNSSVTDQWHRGIAVLHPNIANKNAGTIMFGNEESPGNSGHISFKNSTEDGEEKVSIGIFDKNDLLNIQGNGNVGIGVTNPKQNLEVSGAIKIGYTEENVNTNLADLAGCIRWNATRGLLEGHDGTQNWKDANGNSTGWFAIGKPDWERNDATESIFYKVDSQGKDGYVGIGTNSPERNLDVNDTKNQYAARIKNTHPTGSGLEVVCSYTTSSDSYIFSCERKSTTTENEVTSEYPFVVKSNGKVGIGTATPGDLLHVSNSNGSAYETIDSYRSDQYSGGLLISHSRGTPISLSYLLDNDYLGSISFGSKSPYGYIHYRYAEIHALTTQNHSATAGGTKLVLQTTANDTINKQDRLVIDQNGNVGIGDFSATSPTAKLHISTPDFDENTKVSTLSAGYSAYATGHASVAMGTNINVYGDYSFGISLDTENSYVLSQANTMAIMGGNVGIGTTSPSAKLHVSTPAYDANNIVPILSAGYNTSATGHSSIAIGYETKASGQNSTAMGYGTIAYGKYSTAMGVSSHASGEYSTAIGSHTKASGLVSTATGVGTIASGKYSTAMGAATEANGINSTSMGTKINVGGNYSFGISLNDPSTDYELTQANTMAIIGGKVGIGTVEPTEVLEVDGNITSSGNITAGGDIESTSDIRIKENLEIIENPIEKVKQLNGYTFNKNGEEKRSAGLVAQEVEKVLPEVVSENSDGIKSLAYGNIVALLVETVKDQQKQIDELKKQISNK